VITRLAVRLERAGLFIFQALDYLIGNSFEDGEIFPDWDVSIWDLGFGI
jgi:hypothetical protein